MSIQPNRRTCWTDASFPAEALLRLTVLGTAAFCFGTLPQAQAGEILRENVEAAFQPVSLSVNGSKPAATFHVVLVNNGTSNTINRPRFVATTSVIRGSDPGGVVLPDAIAEFSQSTVSCTVTNDARTSIDCALPSLAPGDKADFTVTFIAPSDGDNIKLAWQAVFDQGTPPGGSNGDAGYAYLQLVPVDSNAVKSDVPINLAVTFFSGIGIATKDDTWVTRIDLPSTANSSGKAEVQENQSVLDNTCLRAADLTTCSRTTLSIVDANLTKIVFGAPYLKITLLRDASTISKGAKISSARIYYKQDPLQVQGILVPSCTDPSNQPLPRSGVPCEDLSQRYEYPRKNSPKTPVAAGYESDWRFVIYALDNGSYEQ